MRYILEIDEKGIPRLKGFNEDLAVQMAAELELIGRMVGAQDGERASHALTNVNERMSTLRAENTDLRNQVSTLRAEAKKYEELNHARGREMRSLFGFNPSISYEEFVGHLRVLGDAYKRQAAKYTGGISIQSILDLQKQFAPYMTPKPIVMDRPASIHRGSPLIWGN